MALADLASVVASGYKQFTVVQWLLVVISFATLISIWNQYIGLSILLNWIPDFRDTTIPFFIGAGELALNHTIPLSLSAWLFVLALLTGMGTLGTWHTLGRAKEEENASLMRMINKWIRWVLVYNLVGSVFTLLCAVLCRVANIQVTDGLQTARGVVGLGIVLLIGAGLDGFLLLFTPAWRQLVAYSRIGHLPGSQTEDAINN